MESQRIWSQHQALTQLEVALTMIEDYEKEDYVKALEVAPQLVLTESDPARFLRYTNFNVAAAARKLVMYWKRRREVFGDRAFLPLTLTGNGALSTENIESIETGSVVFLPNDAAGRTVVCVDGSRRLDFTIETRLRCVFYYGQVLSENEVSQTDGFVLLAISNDSRFIDTASTQWRNLILNTFPMKLKAVHLIKCMPKWANNCLAQAFIGGMVRIYGRFLQGYQMNVHTSQDKNEIVLSLQSHGISRNGLPLRVGGSWSYERFSDWLTERARMDRDREWHREHSLSAAVTAPGGAASLVATDGDGIKSGVFVKRDEMYQYLRKQVAKAIEQLPQEEKASYLEALEKAPAKVWKVECNPDAFLLFEDFHALFAAKRICRYWQLRTETFGPKRFRSLSLTGEEALGTRELKVLQKDSIMFLPKDAQGCPVLSIDGSYLEKRRHWIDARDRCIFYMFSLLAEDDMSQTKGAILLYKMDSPPFRSLDVAFLERLATSLPLRFKSVHLLSHEPISHDVESGINFGDETYAHVGSSNDELASQLEEFGMNKAGLPKYLNGKWGLSKYLQWQELRTRMEWRIPLGYHKRDHSDAFDLPGIRPYNLLPEKEKTETYRRLNVIHCRRKRDQKFVQVDALQEECTELREAQERLLAENSRLEDLVRVSIAMVERVEEEQGDTLSQSGWLSAQTSEHGSKRLSGNKTPASVSTCEPASTTTAAFTGSTAQLNQPLQGECHEHTKASQQQAQQNQFPRSGDVPLQQAPAVAPAASLGLTNIQVETSSPFLSNSLVAAQGLLELGSQSVLGK
jgi:hypothetical protein